MNLFEYDYKGKKLIFRMSHRAMTELETKQEKQYEMLGDPELVKGSLALNKLQKDDATEDEITEAITKVAPLFKNMKALDGSIEPYEVMYILLHVNPKFSDITKEEWDDIVYDMEDTLGFEEVATKFKECSEDVFMLVEKLNAPRQKAIPEQVLKS